MSCLAVGYGGQRSVLTKPFWSRLPQALFTKTKRAKRFFQNYCHADRGFGISSGFHQVFTRFQKIPEVEKNARTSPKHSPGFCHFYQVLTKCLNFTRFSPGFGNFARFSPSFGNFSFFDQLSKFHQVSGFGLPHIRRGSSSRERERSRTMANEMEVGVEPG